MAANKGRLLSCFACFSGNIHSAQPDPCEIDSGSSNIVADAPPLPDHTQGSRHVIHLHTAQEEVLEIESSLTASAPGLAMESDHAEIIWDAAEALDKENVEVDLDGLINYITQLFYFIEVLLFIFKAIIFIHTPLPTINLFLFPSQLSQNIVY